jgi:hypothetical protein
MKRAYDGVHKAHDRGWNEYRKELDVCPCTVCFPFEKPQPARTRARHALLYGLDPDAVAQSDWNLKYPFEFASKIHIQNVAYWPQNAWKPCASTLVAIYARRKERAVAEE